MSCSHSSLLLSIVESIACADTDVCCSFPPAFGHFHVAPSSRHYPPEYVGTNILAHPFVNAGAHPLK
jgi:hypothetical protein